MTTNTHFLSIQLENAARSALNIDSRGGLYGVIDADYIDRIGNAYTVLIAALSPYYKDGTQSDRDLIDSYLEKFDYLSEVDLDREKYFKGIELSTKELRTLINELR